VYIRSCLNFFYNSSFKIKNKSRSATASENVAKRPCKSIRSEEKVEVIGRMEVGELCPDVSSDLNRPPPL
jgi:hypothetical protein